MDIEIELILEIKEHENICKFYKIYYWEKENKFNLSI